MGGRLLAVGSLTLVLVGGALLGGCAPAGDAGGEYREPAASEVQDSETFVRPTGETRSRGGDGGGSEGGGK